MQRAAFIWAKTKSNLKLTLIDDLIDNNCLKKSPRFLIIFVAILDGVFLFQKIHFADKITKKSSNTQKYLHISQKSSTFAPDFSIVRWRVAIVAQLVEQRIRNAWVAGLEAENWAKMDWIAM